MVSEWQELWALGCTNHIPHLVFPSLFSLDSSQAWSIPEIVELPRLGIIIHQTIYMKVTFSTFFLKG